MSIARFARALLISTALLLAIPAFAAAATITVNSTLDEEDASSGTGVCETSTPGECTLRAALETSNASASDDDEIKFAASFNGQAVDTIVPFLGPLPEIKDPVIVNGTSAGPCVTESGPKGPCVGVDAGSFKVEAQGATIRGIAITGIPLAINVFNGSTGFVAEGNWLGVQLDGEFDTGTPSGIYVAPGSNEALIGGDTEAERNVFAHSETYGLWINGASNTKVRGNYFGVEPDGTTEASNGRNIVVTDDGSNEAKSTEIGETIEGSGGPTAACDEGCNVIAAAMGEGGTGPEGTGINLVSLGGGGDPASGPTTIHGNYIGLDATGLGTLGNDEAGVVVGTAGQVEIGGEEAGDANYFAGGEFGVLGGDADNLKVRGNSIGVGPTGAAVTPPSEIGISTRKETQDGLDEFTEIVGNTLRMGEESVGIEHQNYGAVIRDNSVEGGGRGIRLDGSIWGGSLVEGNEITAPEDEGILITNKDNAIYGNEVTGAGEVGIEVQASVASISGNLIGGNTDLQENAIFDSDANAIVISGVAESRNQVGRNHGSGNGGEGGFLVLRGDDPNGAEPPDILVAAKTEASGDEALPGARVRVFFKASPEEGELGGFLGEAIANPSGEWKVSYAAVPGKTMITATQTNTEGGTSSLSEVATTPADPPVNPPCTVNCGGGNQPPPTPPTPPDTTKPKVTITKAPKAKSTGTTAKFVFSSDKAGSKFKCKLDNKVFANCSSPKTYKKLKPGKHVFKVKATDAAGNVSAVVTRKFTVLAPN